MVGLKQRRFYIMKVNNYDLHSTMVGLKPTLYKIAPIFNYKFTFHYGRIKTHEKSLKNKPFQWLN